ncbi:MAG: hypothetical protein AB7S78_09915 [Candidatus Omnitrophota bacterium]
MKKFSRIGFLVVFTAGISFISFATESRNPTADAVIAKAEIIPDHIDRHDYLIGNARKFIQKRDYRNAREVTEYIIYNIDGESTAANDILDTFRTKFEKGS